MATTGFALKSYEFRKEREGSWSELEQLLERVQKQGVSSLGADELTRLPHLYRAALSSLSVARAISLDKNVVAYLENLTARAYFVVYGTKVPLRTAIWEFLGYRFPIALRRQTWPILLATIALLLGGFTGFLVTDSDPDRFYSFVSADYAQGRNPATTTSELKGVLYDEVSHGEWLSSFTAFLFTHNAKIGILAFAVGFLFGVPVIYLMFVNGLTLGAFAALYHGRGLATDFWGWILPHGVTELFAVVICGGAGFVLAQAIIFPGRFARLRSLANAGREAGVLVLGAVVMFFIAGIIEGVFRQTVQSVPIRYTVAASSAALWIAYVALAGRRRQTAEGES